MTGFKFQISGNGRFIMMMVIAVALILWSTFLMQQRVKQMIQMDLAHSTHALLDASYKSLASWRTSQSQNAREWASSPHLLTLTNELLKLQPKQETLSSAAAQHELRQWLLPVQKYNRYLGFFIISPDYINLASSRDSNVGKTSFLKPHYLKRVFSGETLITPP
ncbi:MAG: hypothetical protein HUJ30_03960, partial [Gammaproteobacteria bacterium]|nr:hypothetical protein [Gammaproteobacteria bacterium]